MAVPQERSFRLSARTLVVSGLRELIQRPPTQLAGLDALRSAAILLVIGSHWAGVFYAQAGGQHTPLQEFPLFYYGWTGVDLFFVLSGYLIGKQLWRELDATGGVQIGRFLLRRGLRIWPLYVAMLLYYTAFNPDINPRLADWTFLSNYWPGGVARTWSLSTEEQFYIAVPVLLAIFRKRWGLAQYFWILLACEVVVLFVRYGALQALFARGGDYTRADYTLIYPFHVHLEGLLAGLVLALVSVVRPQLFQRRSAAGISWLGIAVCVSCVALAIGLRAYQQRLFAFVTLGLIYGGLTFWVLSDRSWLSRPLGAAIFYPISRLSYGMYLNHGWALPFTNTWSLTLAQAIVPQREASFLLSLVFMTLVSMAFATVTFVCIEHPFLMLRARWLNGAATQIPAPSSDRVAA